MFLIFYNYKQYLKNAAILLVSLFIFCTMFAAFFVYLAKVQEKDIEKILSREQKIIEEIFLNKFNITHKIIEEMNGEIIKNRNDKKKILQIITTIKTQHNLNDIFPWTIFSWTNPQNEIIVDSFYGVMKKPHNLSNRDYIQFTSKEPNIFFLGTPVFGSTSKKWMIPGGVGVNLDGKYLGTMTIGFEIEVLAKIVHNSIKNSKVNFTLVNSQNTPILYANSYKYGNCRDNLCKIDDITSGFINQGEKEVFYIKNINEKKAIMMSKLDDYPYILILEYDKNEMKKELIETYKTKIKIFTIFAIFLISLIFSYRLVFI